MSSSKRLKLSNLKIELLLDLTLSINNNVPIADLLNLFEDILINKLGIGKILVFSFNDKWECILSKGVSKNITDGIRAESDLLYYKKATSLSVALNPNLELFDIIIPVNNNNHPSAYVIIGDVDEEQAGVSPTIKHLNFVQTLSNIIIIAIENKRLFRESARQDAFKKELEQASQMQTMLIPNPEELPNNDKIEASAYYLPHFDVGGDYYDFIRLSPNEYGFCIADVSGKGISAAILMSNFQANIRTLFSAKTSLQQTVNELNTKVIESAYGEKFITLFIGKYNTKTRKLEYINAGHNPPILFNKDIDSTEMLHLGCTGVGMFDEIPKIELGEVTLSKGSKIVCYTDGIVELENDNGVQFGTRIIEQSIRKSERISYVIKDIIDQLHDYKGENDFFDDISLIGVEFH